MTAKKSITPHRPQRSIEKAIEKFGNSKVSAATLEGTLILIELPNGKMVPGRLIANDVIKVRAKSGRLVKLKRETARRRGWRILSTEQENASPIAPSETAQRLISAIP